MDRYLKEHEGFINEINDMRSKCKADKNAIKSDNCGNIHNDLLTNTQPKQFMSQNAYRERETSAKAIKC